MTSAQQPVRWGILATGGIAHMFVKDLLQHGHTVTAVGSRSEQSASAFAQEYNIPRAYGSYEALVQDPDVDAIYVATPHNFHRDNASLALEHGKHVLVEKAFTLNGHEAEELLTLAEARGLLLMEAMWTRFLPHMQFIRQTIADGVLGDIRALHAEHAQSLPTEEEHRINNPHLGGGALLDLGIYPISFAWDILGRPSTLQAKATFKPSGVDASVATIFSYESGAIATTFSSSEVRGANTASIQGTKARMEIDTTWYEPTTVRVINTDGDLVSEYSSEVTGRGMQYQAQEFERLLAAGERSSELLPTRQSVQIMETLDAVRREIGFSYPGEITSST